MVKDLFRLNFRVVIFDAKELFLHKVVSNEYPCNHRFCTLCILDMSLQDDRYGDIYSRAPGAKQFPIVSRSTGLTLNNCRSAKTDDCDHRACTFESLVPHHH